MHMYLGLTIIIILLNTIDLMCVFLTLVMVFRRYFLFYLTFGKIFSLQNMALSLS